MSGGPLHFVHYQLQSAAESIAIESHGRRDQEDLAAFAEFLQRVAEVVRSIDYDLGQDSTLTPADYEVMRAMVRSVIPGADGRP